MKILSFYIKFLNKNRFHTALYTYYITLKNILFQAYRNLLHNTDTYNTKTDTYYTKTHTYNTKSDSKNTKTEYVSSNNVRCTWHMVLGTYTWHLAYFTWHLTGLQERHLEDMGIPVHLPFPSSLSHPTTSPPLPRRVDVH